MMNFKIIKNSKRNLRVKTNQENFLNLKKPLYLGILKIFLKASKFPNEIILIFFFLLILSKNTFSTEFLIKNMFCLQTTKCFKY